MSTAAATVSLRPPAVLADVVARGWVRDASLVAAVALLTALGAQVAIHVPPSPVPVTGQTLAVLVGSAALGARRGVMAQLLYVLAGLVAPIYADGAHGFHVLTGATGGYLVGFVLAGWAVGRLAEMGADRRPAVAFASFLAGQLLIFGVGVPWLKIAANLDWSTAVHEGFTIFLVAGVIKALVAGIAMPAAWRLVPRSKRAR